jgi:hypothetical protein
MLEAELFGFEAGAFTDARRAKPGLFEAASTGTLFLDQIDSLSLALQAKLLKAIEEKSVRRLGAGAARHVEVQMLRTTQGARCPGQRGSLPRRSLPPAQEPGAAHPVLREAMTTRCCLAEHFPRVARAHVLTPRTLSGDALAAQLPVAGQRARAVAPVERVTLLEPEGEPDASQPRPTADRRARSRWPAGRRGCDYAAGAGDRRRRGGGRRVRAAPQRAGARGGRGADPRRRLQCAALPDAPPGIDKPSSRSWRRRSPSPASTCSRSARS